MRKFLIIILYLSILNFVLFNRSTLMGVKIEKIKQPRQILLTIEKGNKYIARIILKMILTIIHDINLSKFVFFENLICIKYSLVKNNIKIVEKKIQIYIAINKNNSSGRANESKK